jgi:hypothetical protein
VGRALTPITADQNRLAAPEVWLADLSVEESQLQPLTVVVNARVQARLGAIDARAKLVPERATWKEWNDPSLPRA